MVKFAPQSNESYYFVLDIIVVLRHKISEFVLSCRCPMDNALLIGYTIASLLEPLTIKKIIIVRPNFSLKIND